MVVVMVVVPMTVPVSDLQSSSAPVQQVSALHFTREPVAPIYDPMAEEIGPYLRDLFEALRPSVRETAATALAECRYGSRPEVKALLAKAAAFDPCPDVCAHCIGLMSRLGYHEPRYIEDLTAWADSGPEVVRKAARAALAKLAAK